MMQQNSRVTKSHRGFDPDLPQVGEQVEEELARTAAHDEVEDAPLQHQNEQEHISQEEPNESLWSEEELNRAAMHGEPGGWLQQKSRMKKSYRRFDPDLPEVGGQGGEE